MVSPVNAFAILGGLLGGLLGAGYFLWLNHNYGAGFLSGSDEIIMSAPKRRRNQR